VCECATVKENFCIASERSGLGQRKYAKRYFSTTLKGTVSRENLYSIFSIDHILLVLLELLDEDLKFRRIIQPKRKLASVGYTGESGLLSVAYTGESGLIGVGYTGKFGLPGVAYTGEYRSLV
jgi:hypothetical protein